MAAQFPSAIANIRRIQPGDYMDGTGTELDLSFNRLADEIEAIEAIVGVTGSAVSGTVEKRLTDATATSNAALPATQAACGTLIAAASSKATPADADSVALSDSAASGTLKKLTWGNLRAALASLFASLSGSAGGQTLIGGTASGENLTLRSTAHATKGAIILGAASSYDEENNRLGIGTLTPSANVHSMATTEQLRLGYDASNYLSALVASSGLVTLTGTLGQYRLSGPTDSQASATLGANLITNGGFTSDLSGWTAGAGWSWSAGVVAHSSGTATLGQSVTVTSGSTYQLSLTISNRTVGSISIALGSASFVESGVATAFTLGTFKRTVVAVNSGTVSLTITPTTDFNGSIDNVSLAAVTLGSHPAVLGITESGSPALEIRQSLVRSNLSFGRDSGRSNTTGSNNSNAGMNAGYSNTTGNSNSNFGVSAGYSNTTGSSSSNAGMNAGYSNTTGNSNSNFGVSAGYSNTTGNNNSNFGSSAGHGITTGSSNITVGNDAGRYLANGVTWLTTPSNCCYVGANSKASANGIANENVFGYNATGIGSNSCVIGSSAVTKCQIFGDIILDKTVTAVGTTGAQTIDKTVGSVNFAAAATSIVVTNNRVTPSSIIIATVATNDSTLKSVTAVAASGSFTLYANAAATAETRVNFIVFN
jgi:hypothetical protein